MELQEARRMANAYDYDQRTYADLFEGLLTRRMLAFVIDYAIVLLLMIPAAVVVFFLGVLTLGLGFYLYPVLFFIIAGLYFGLSLSSYAQATPGMRVMDIMMVSDSGHPIDFLTAILHLVIFWILNSLLTPFILLAGLFTDRKRLLHDIALGTTQVRASRWLAPNYR
jgi:uncharacterized RDD family membrane protein YckC